MEEKPSRKRKEEGENSNSQSKRAKNEASVNLESSFFTFLSKLTTKELMAQITMDLQDTIPGSTRLSLDETIVLAGFKSQDECNRRSVQLCDGRGENPKEVARSFTKCAELLDTRTVKYQMGNVKYDSVPELLKRRICRNLSISKNRNRITFRSRQHKRTLLICNILAKVCSKRQSYQQ